MESTYLGKYYFEVSMILRESLLLNSEAWVNYTDKDIRVLEQCDEMLLSSILECDQKWSNAFKYLELGVIPIRFEIMYWNRELKPVVLSTKNPINRTNFVWVIKGQYEPKY